MIKKAAEIINTGHKIRMLIAGFPGLGKTTLALSAPRPLLIDTDRGVARVNAAHREADVIQPVNYQELLDDLKNSPLRGYDTIIIDTGMSLLNLMKLHVIQKDTKNGKRDGSLSLQGYGAVGREFQSFIDLIYYQHNKNVVVVFHAKEDKDDDKTKLRILIEGQTKDNVWQCMDIGGFMEMENNSRVIQFQNCERFFAKRTFGISEKYQINELKDNVKNDFLTKLFEEVEANIQAEQAAQDERKAQYQAIMDKYDFTDPDIEINSLMEMIKKENHVLTSEIELREKFRKKVKDEGYVYDKEQQRYVLDNTQST